ncbi:MAG: ATP-binding cassette domain-containing protein, partial [Gemmatimonadales bacterium]
MLIRLKHVEKNYDTGAGRTFVLRNINIDIEKGEFMTVMGPSGAGKTTLLNIVGMLDGDWAGEYYLDGQAVHDLSTKQRNALGKKYVGFVFQQYHLLNDLTVAENLDL